MLGHIQTLNSNGDDIFKSYSYGLDTSMYRFAEDINKHDSLKMIIKTSPTEEKFLSVEGWSEAYPETYYAHTTQIKNAEGIYEDVVDLKVYYRTTYVAEEFNQIVGEGKDTVILMYSDRIFFNFVNISTKAQIKGLSCINAFKYFEDGFDFKSILSTNEDPNVALTETWTNWKSFIRNAYNFNRLTATWQTVCIMGAINIGITGFMGFMIWILTRGKNNPYRIYTIWETQKIAYWCAPTPALLTLAFGFLFTNFANVLFPMLIGVRTMWLSMKSLRPDGSGYAD